ncbi:hypothetical protein [uncultured Zobellia sp.]|uniref:hypothetical protein n=1 Tax=uncultured Zobellia sp. TaxID=255433 RepID=UPI00259A493A|nr:hypothetical protein [uncultured Zobellia sp.]
MQETQILNENTNISEIQVYCFIVGISWAGLWLPIKHVYQSKKYSKKDEVFNELVAYNKNNIFEIAGRDLGLLNHKLLCTRVFKPVNGIEGLWLKYIRKKCVLKLCNVDSISDEFHHKSLKFEVGKELAQGMVGLSYRDHSIHIDLDLTTNNYNITEAQRTKIGNIGFLSTVPIFNKDQSKVVAVIAVDSVQKLDLNVIQKRKWEDSLTRYAAFIDKHIKL